MRNLKRTAASLLVAGLAITGCGGGGGKSGPTGPSPSAVVSLMANPNPMQGGPCGGCGSAVDQRESVTQLTAAEVGGVAATASLLEVELRLDSGELLGSGSFDAAAITTIAGTVRLPAGGRLVLPNVGSHYSASRAGLAGTLTYTLRLTDDNQHALAVTLGVRTLT